MKYYAVLSYWPLNPSDSEIPVVDKSRFNGMHFVASYSIGYMLYNNNEFEPKMWIPAVYNEPKSLPTILFDSHLISENVYVSEIYGEFHISLVET